jgi:glycolate oxidase FAD binding subunit
MGSRLGGDRVTLSPPNAAELSDIVRDAAGRKSALRIEGRGGWNGAGTPSSRIRGNAQTVSLAKQTGILNYVPADLTLTARAGTTLAELSAETARHGQWCPLLAWGDDDGTIGATFATATSGPCARALGRPRDIALGVEFVDGTGAVVRAGGRVVKNVAGFDLTRLVVGSFGALGILTEVTVRLRSRPRIDVTWLLSPKSGLRDASAVESLRKGEFVPWACEPVEERFAKSLGLPAGSIVVRFGGNQPFIDAVRSSLGATFNVSDADPSVWTRLRALDPYPRSSGTNALAGSIAGRVKSRFDPAGILNPGVLGELA